MKRILSLIALACGFVVPAFALAADVPAVCTREYQPVCAAKPVQCVAAPCYPVYETYSNSCVAEGDHAAVIHAGACAAAEAGPVAATATTSGAYEPPAGCLAWNDGCNSCSKAANGQAICTLKACIGPVQLGYCTQFEESMTQDWGGAPAATSSDDASTTAPAHEAGFLARLWHAFLSLFR
jgi:hypothetical protein